MSGTDRTLDIIEAFSDCCAPLLLPEIATRLGAPKSTCFELVKTLQARGYLYALGKRRGFYPTRRLLTHAENIARHDPLASLFDDAMRQLLAATNETVTVGRLQHETVQYLAVLESPQTIRYSTVPGDRKPLHSSAIGKALLAGLDDDFVTARSVALESFTENTITTTEALIKDLRNGVRRGYFKTVGENVRDVMALARPLRIGSELVALAVAGPIYRMKPEEGRIAEELRRVTAQLEQ